MAKKKLTAKKKSGCHPDYDKMKQQLKKKKWKEQSAGEIYSQGEFSTNFIKDGIIIHVSCNTWPDEETIDTLMEKW
jgi:hypothetical protein